tara:strand:- start:17218 stop:17520 length:303 start_codon:yes stop_codon:yes gene_type:complete
MAVTTPEPVRTSLISKTPRIHMRNAFSLSQIGERHRALVIITNPRTERMANVDDVIALMLLEIKLDDKVEVSVYVDEGSEDDDHRINKILEEIKDVFLTP